MSPLKQKAWRLINKHKPSRILSQRIFKCTINSTVALILCLDLKTRDVLGGQEAMLPLLSVMVHPGRRLGTMVEAVIFCSSGLLIGNAYALLARFVAQKVLGSEGNLVDTEQFLSNYDRYRAALAVLALFEMIMLFFHGWMRSITPKFFGIVFPLFLVVHFAFVSDISTSARIIAKNFTVPFFLGIALSLACNLLIFPEFGSSHLGTSMISTLNEFQTVLDNTVQFFITANNQTNPYYKVKALSLPEIVKNKSTLRSKLNSTQVILQECSYEISYSYLSPTGLKGVISSLKEQLSYINALINATQLQYTTLLKDDGSSPESELLIRILKRAKTPIFELQKKMSQSLYISKLAIAYSYDVKESEVNISENLELDSVDIHQINFSTKVNDLVQGMVQFDLTFREELKKLSAEDDESFSPNKVMFLLSLFLMNLKETANCTCNILKESQNIYQIRLSRENEGIFGRKLWLSSLTSFDKLKGWFNANSNNMTNSSEMSNLNGDTQSKVFVPDNATHIDIDPTLDDIIDISEPQNIIERILIRIIKFYQEFKPHFRFGSQITIGLMLSSFPMFIPESRRWYEEYRGSWIAFVCILVLEPEVGSTFFVFFLRGLGVISGAVWGYLSYVAGVNQTNPYLETIVTVIGAAPGYYYFLGTQYVKAAIIGIISIYIVLLSSVIPSEFDQSIATIFAKRCLALIYGGVVALACQLIFFPMKARDELVKEVAYSLGAISKMLLLYASGLEGERVQLSLSQTRYNAFKSLSETAKLSLIKTDGLRNAAKREPRLKGSYDEIEKIFFEVTFILREILDRLDNIIELRRSYGSAIIEEFNVDVHAYRRQLSASMSNSLKCVQLALLTKSPLPHYLPSARICQQRLIERVKEAVKQKYYMDKRFGRMGLDSDSELVVNFADKRNRRAPLIQQGELLKTEFLSWNATTAATEEIIQFIDVLLEFSQMLVGVNEFKYGFLSRSLYADYAVEATKGYNTIVHERSIIGHPDTDNSSEVDAFSFLQRDEIEPVGLSAVEQHKPTRMGLTEAFRQRANSIGSWINREETRSIKSLAEVDESQYGGEDVPLSLMRVLTKKLVEDQ